MNALDVVMLNSPTFHQALIAEVRECKTVLQHAQTEVEEAQRQARRSKDLYVAYMILENAEEILADARRALVDSGWCSLASSCLHLSRLGP